MSQVKEGDLAILYEELDKAIEQSPKYIAAYEERITQARNALEREKGSESQMALCLKLFQMYKAYKNDSALTYIQRYIDLAKQLQRPLQAERGRVLMAYQYSTVGLFTESLGILRDINSKQLPKVILIDYYLAYAHVYGELSNYTCMSSMRSEYDHIRNEYNDSVFHVADPLSDAYLQCLEQQLCFSQPDSALTVNDHRLAKVQAGTHDYAIVCYFRHLIYNELKQPEQTAYWLCQSAIADVKNAVMDQASLIELADMMNREGNIERSYRYIRFTLDCNNSFDKRMRSWHIMPILNVIETNYQNELQSNNRVLIFSMVALSVLALLLLGLLLFLRHRNKQLNAARLQVNQANEQLEQSNSKLADQARELSELNIQQNLLNNRLSTLNTQLSEANQVKEEYIGQFMSLCSQYVNKLDGYRRMVNKKMKNKELDELFRLTKTTELKERELEELFQNFDSVFLNLFPTFVDDFNALLEPEYREQPKDANHLTTDLRIFALIRLGIEESSKIAEFLNYSVRTIYNYRARKKNGALGDRDLFEQHVKEIGRPKP